MQVRAWNTISEEAMSKEAIAALYQPEIGYRITEYTYPAGTKFQGAMRAGTCYVLAGACKLTFHESVWVRAGEFVTMPGGNFSVEVGPDDPVTLINVWELPEHIVAALQSINQK